MRTKEFVQQANSNQVFQFLPCLLILSVLITALLWLSLAQKSFLVLSQQCLQALWPEFSCWTLLDVSFNQDRALNSATDFLIMFSGYSLSWFWGRSPYVLVSLICNYVSQSSPPRSVVPFCRKILLDAGILLVNTLQLIVKLRCRLRLSFSNHKCLVYQCRLEYIRRPHYWL